MRIAKRDAQRTLESQHQHCPQQADLQLLPEALCALAGSARMRTVPFLAALAVGSLAMGFAFSFLGEHYVDSPAAGLIISAMIPLAVWPPVHYLMNRRPRTRPTDAAVPGEQGRVSGG